MDTNNSGQTPATDDQELAKVLAGMNQQAAAIPVDTASDGLQYEESGVPPAPTPEISPDFAPPAIEPDLAQTTATDASVTDTPVTAPVADPSVVPVSASPELDSLKKDALEQLRPLVDRLNLPAQEKFDTLLLIIRSTDDQSLLGAASEAAKLIEDETKRAEALLDIIKEIDFFTLQTAKA